jgi:putative addiction module CopG family antidote
MQIDLPPELEAFVQEMVASGRYRHPNDVVYDALWFLKDQYELHRGKLVELKKMIAVGLEQIDRGEVAPLDIEAITAKAVARLRQEEGPGANEQHK